MPIRHSLHTSIISHGASCLVLTLEVLEKSLVEICRDAVEQRPQYSLGKLVIVQIFDLHREAEGYIIGIIP